MITIAFTHTKYIKTLAQASALASGPPAMPAKCPQMHECDPQTCPHQVGLLG